MIKILIERSYENYSPIDVAIDIAFLKDDENVLYSIAHEHEIRVIDNQLAVELKQMGIKIGKYAR